MLCHLLSCLALAAALAAGASAQPRGATAEALVRQAYADLARGDAAAVVAVLDDHVLWREGDRRSVGPGTVGAFVLEPALGRQAVWLLDSLSTSGDHVIVTGEARWLDPTTGAPLSARFRDAWLVLDGRVVGVAQSLEPHVPVAADRR